MSEARQAAITRASGAVSLITAGLSATRFLLDGPGSSVGAVLAAGALVFALLAVEGGRRLGVTTRGSSVAGVGLIALTAMSGLEGGLASEAMVWLPFTPIAAALLVDHRAAIGVAVGASAWVGLLLTVSHAEHDLLQGAAVLGATWFGATLATLYDRQRQAEARSAQAREASLRTLLDQLPLGLLVVDRDDRVLHRSNLRHTLAHADASWLEKLEQLRRGGTPLAEAVAAVVAEARTHGSPAQRPVTSGEGLAERQVELRALPLPDGRTAVAALDVTAHARAARREDAFVANVSHELRTPLAATLGALRLLAHGLDKLTPEQWPALLEVALRNTERLTELVDDLLHLKELEDGAMPPTLVTLDLHEVAVAVRTELALFASDAGIALRVDGGAAMAWADVSRVHQILVNLVSNAVKFSEPGTVVRVVCGTRDGSGYVDVVDQGRGIPDDQRDTVFRRFGQVDTESDRAAGGTGLGLPLSRALAEQMGGSLDFESREGEGTTFTLSMPTPPFG